MATEWLLPIWNRFLFLAEFCRSVWGTSMVQEMQRISAYQGVHWVTSALYHRAGKSCQMLLYIPWRKRTLKENQFKNTLRISLCVWNSSQVLILWNTPGPFFRSLRSECLVVSEFPDTFQQCLIITWIFFWLIVYYYAHHNNTYIFLFFKKFFFCIMPVSI